MEKFEQFKNKKILITGGTSGLGEAFTDALVSMGAQVVIVARGRSGLEKMKARHTSLGIIQADVGRKTDIHMIAGEAHTLLGEIDILMNVASSLGPTPLKLLVDTDCEELGSVLETNLLGPFRLIKAIIPTMLLRNYGLVINISSDAAITAYPGWGSYAVSKAALDHLTRIFDLELKNQGVRFCSIDPGDMNTPMHFAAVPDANPADLKNPRDVAKKILSLVAGRNFDEVRRVL